MQASDGDGKLTFASVFPAAYAGRWPHIHFEVYESLDAATSAGSSSRPLRSPSPRTPATWCTRRDGYEQSAQNLAQTSLETDIVFSDGYASQVADWSGSPRDRIKLALNVGV